MPLPSRLALAVAASTLLLLTGCSLVAPVPPGPTDAELEANRQRILDASWQSTGLEGLVERPVSVPAGQSSGDALGDLFACLETAGVGDIGVSYSETSGYSIFSGVTSMNPQYQQLKLSFYTCLTSMPDVQLSGLPQWSDAQLDYLYDHYKNWILPCLEAHGFSLLTVPTRSEYRAIEGNWSPYNYVGTITSSDDYNRFVDLCGSEYPGLDYPGFG